MLLSLFALFLVAALVAAMWSKRALRIPAAMGLMVAFSAVPAFAQDLGQVAQDKATQAVTAGAIVAGIILGAVILYRIIKRFSS